jgi:hypothetical protein
MSPEEGRVICHMMTAQMEQQLETGYFSSFLHVIIFHTSE